MKQIACALVILTGLVFCGKNREQHSADQAGIKATLSYLSGTVQVERAGQKQKAEIGSVLKPSDVILTAKGATADVVIAGIGIVKLGEDTRAEVVSLAGNDQRTNAEMKLHRGD